MLDSEVNSKTLAPWGEARDDEAVQFYWGW